MSNEIRDSDDLIHAYLRGRLTDEEAAGLEERLESDPRQWREFERVLRAHEGLQQLRARGELTRLLSSAPWYRRAPALAAAAALASVAVGAKLLLQPGAGGKDPALSTSRGNQGFVAHLLLARSRGAAPMLARPAGGLIEIRVRPEYPSHSHFDLELTLPAADSKLPQRLTARNVPLDAEGLVSVSLTANDLPLGEYLLRLSPANGDPAESSDFEFTIAGSGTLH